MRRRLVIDVKPGSAPDGAELAGPVWWVEWRGFRRREWWYGRANAIEQARDQAREHHAHGGLAQVVVHKRDGKIARNGEWTYGEDPRSRKG